jgi:hypothetical protein
MATTPEQTHRAGAQQANSRSRPSPQLTRLSEAARRLLRGAPPVAAPMISRDGVRGEAHRVRSILRATMKDQQLIEGK